MFGVRLCLNICGGVFSVTVDRNRILSFPYIGNFQIKKLQSFLWVFSVYGVLFVQILLVQDNLNLMTDGCKTVKSFVSNFLTDINDKSRKEKVKTTADVSYFEVT